MGHIMSRTSDIVKLTIDKFVAKVTRKPFSYIPLCVYIVNAIRKHL